MYVLTSGQRAILQAVLAGGIYHGRRLAHMLSNEKLRVCAHCGHESEDIEHIFWHCPAWAPIRADVLKIVTLEDIGKWPACTRCCGIFQQKRDYTPYQERVATETRDYKVERPPTYDRKEVEEIFDHDGFQLVATDAACPRQQTHVQLRRAGGGIYYGPNHPMNRDEKLPSIAQNAQRGELHMMKKWACWSWGKQRLITDSGYAHTSFQKLRRGEHFKPKSHKDLWEVIARAIEAKGAENLDSEHVKAHRTKKEKAAMTPRQAILSSINDEADKAAVRAASSWKLPDSLHDEAALVKKLANEVQWMMITIITARSLVRKELGFAALDAQAEKLSEQSKHWLDAGWQPNQDSNSYEEEEDLWAGCGLDHMDAEEAAADLPKGHDTSCAGIHSNRSGDSRGTAATPSCQPISKAGVKRSSDGERKVDTTLASTPAEQLAKKGREEVFPNYCWGRIITDADKYFEPTVPDNLGSEQWGYPQSLFPALVWYWKQVGFAKTGDSKIQDTTWAEIAVDFQHATHEDLDRRDAEEATLERRSRFIAAATDQMAKLCKTTVLGKAYKREKGAKATSLQHLGWGSMAGIPRRMVFLCPTQTLETLYRTAVQAGEMEGIASKSYNTAKVKPRMENAVAPLWSGGRWRYQAPNPPKRRLKGKQPAPAWAEKENQGERVAAALASRSAKHKRRALPHKLVASKALWSSQEKKKLSGLTGRLRHLQEKLLLHNRKAAAEKLHVVELLDPRVRELPDVVSCAVCKGQVAREQLQKWLERECGKTVQLQQRDCRPKMTAATRLAWMDKLKAAGHIIDKQDPDDKELGTLKETIRCRRCLRTIQLARVAVMARSPCDEERTAWGPKRLPN
jgi:hypothetical protein